MAHGFRRHSDVYGNGVVLLGFPYKQTRAREIWASWWCSMHPEEKQTGRGMIDGNLYPYRRSTRSSTGSGDGFTSARRRLQGGEGVQE
jgi:hypothetical protein